MIKKSLCLFAFLLLSVNFASADMNIEIVKINYIMDSSSGSFIDGDIEYGYVTGFNFLVKATSGPWSTRGGGDILFDVALSSFPSDNMVKNGISDYLIGLDFYNKAIYYFNVKKAEAEQSNMQKFLGDMSINPADINKIK